MHPGSQRRWLATLWNLAFRASLGLGQTSVAARCAARAVLSEADRPTIPRPSLLVGGLGRVGKTILAAKLSRDHGYVHLRTDECLDYFFSIPDYERRLHFRKCFYAHILERMPEGAVIEGDDLILENRRRIAKTDHPVDIGPAQWLSDRFGVQVFLLGNADVSPEQKVRAFERYSATADCWTTTLRDVPKYARWLIRVSRELRELADEKQVHYVELDVEHFDESVDALVQSIIHDEQAPS